MNDSYLLQSPIRAVRISRQACRCRQAARGDWPASNSASSGWVRKIVSLLGLMLFLGGSLTAHAELSMSEYQVKALFLLNFLKYVDWPTEATPGTPIVIGILGQDNFDENLTRAIQGKNINGRAIIIKHLSAGDDPSSCAILFISSSATSQLSDILRKTSRLPILTVGENESFLQNGGIIDFILKEGKIQIEINLKAAQKVNLQISSKLLSVASRVEN